MTTRSWVRLVGVSVVVLSNTLPHSASASPARAAQRQPSLHLSPGNISSSRIDQPTATVWPGLRSWTPQLESEYSAFVVSLGEKIAQRRCRTLAACLNDSSINPDPEPLGRDFRFRADCADVPYILRAYFSYRHDLPFGFTKEMRGQGRDARYYRNARPEGVRTWRDYATPRKLFESLSSAVHSGYFRTAPDIERADFYQTTVDRTAIRPGTTYYDPNGHVLVVYGLRENGEVLTFDGHPDGFLTFGSLSEKNVRGGESQGGGFKNFRPLRVQNDSLSFAKNGELTDFGGNLQFDKRRYVVDGVQVNYHAWVRSQLRLPTLATAEKESRIPSTRTANSHGGVME